MPVKPAAHPLGPPRKMLDAELETFTVKEFAEP
jgi:hypothetical protein